MDHRQLGNSGLTVSVVGLGCNNLGRASTAAETLKGSQAVVGAALDGLFDELGWRGEVNVHLILGRWAEIVGAAVADHSTPEHYRDHVLTVRAESTAWASACRCG